MRVVSNTSPILNLAIVGYLHLLHEQKAGFYVGWELRRMIEANR
jgi:predicted nucleic acid-binding protein